jgi:hypothetical protein
MSSIAALTCDVDTASEISIPLGANWDTEKIGVIQERISPISKLPSDLIQS